MRIFIWLWVVIKGIFANTATTTTTTTKKEAHALAEVEDEFMEVSLTI
jgi:hypothetical protein